jgi:hypothetical protein
VYRPGDVNQCAGAARRRTLTDGHLRGCCKHAFDDAAGIHYRFDMEAGLALGRAAANKALTANLANVAIR